MVSIHAFRARPFFTKIAPEKYFSEYAAQRHGKCNVNKRRIISMNTSVSMMTKFLVPPNA